MKCKFCSAEWEGESTICPVCGKENEEDLLTTSTEETPQEPVESLPETPSSNVEEGQENAKMSPGRIALFAILAVAVVAVVVALIVSTMHGRGADATEPTVSSEETTAPTEATLGDPNSVTYRNSYTVSDEDLLTAADQVVATLGDDVKLTNQQLQVYYWMTYFDFMNSYGSYASYFGLDASMPLDQQDCPQGGTWQQYFLSNALTSWQQFQSLSLCAQEEDFSLSDEQQNLIDQIPADLEKTAASNGYDSVEDLMFYSMGPGITVENYQQYMYNYQLGYLYFENKYNQFQHTDEEISTYFDENQETFSANGVTKDDGSINVDVRHVLLQPENGTTDDQGQTTYTEAAWEACRLQAEELLEQWRSGDTSEESFAQLASQHSQDPGSVSNGGLYSNVKKGDMVAPFEDWCFDESRKTGDTGLVKTDYGYHIMYFVSSTPVWYTQAKAALLSEKSQSIVSDCVAKFPMTVDYTAIVVGEIPEDPTQSALQDPTTPDTTATDPTE